ncbi:prevent-host-death protein [Pseudomonas sp. ANT_J28]|uniref:prevent-host-death protein n=1 Tax=Pseudomonas sp. ANT_J28 TaxID=2597352 RepID=UPI0011F36A24|nr:prevent-host-death protein [Pseudomonas sp. ANT_J28]KAA0986164.1 prevent-host-death protein [Pseudomonas sp. ANT_J28]
MIESYEKRKRRDETIALIRLLSFSSRDKEQGKLISGDMLLEKLAKRRQLLQYDNDG